MVKGKGLSMDEKCTEVANYIVKQREPFTLKELEKLLPKAVKGVNFKMVKEILTTLVAEGRVESDKMGASTYYWMFPSAAASKRKKRRDDFLREVTSLRNKKEKLQQDIEESMMGKEDSEERKQNIKLFKELQERRKQLEKQLEKYSEFDPKLIAKIESDSKIAFGAASRWTDNVYMIRDFVTKKYNADGKTFDKQFGIDKMEDIE